MRPKDSKLLIVTSGTVQTQKFLKCLPINFDDHDTLGEMTLI